MSKITMITSDVGPSLAEKISVFGKFVHVHKDNLREKIETVRKQRDTDLLITAMPPDLYLTDEGYLRTINLIYDTIMDLKIPVIVYTTCDFGVLRFLTNVPIFLVHRTSFAASDWELVKLVGGISQFWFPMPLAERNEFMTKTLIEFVKEVPKIKTRESYMNAKFKLS